MRRWLGALAAAVIACAGVLLGPASGASAATHTPVVFVHGYTGSPSNWTTAIALFEAAGYSGNELYAFSYNSYGDNKTNAQSLASYVNQVKAKTAEGRFTGYVLVAFPLVMFLITNALSPAYGEMLRDTKGLMMLGFAGALMMLGLLVDLWRRMKEYGGALCICGIDPQLGRVFRITHLDKIFRFCRDLPEALEALKTRDDRTE